MVSIADAVEFSKFHLVGHDWGAGVGWTVVELYKDRVNDWTALSIPHMASFNHAKHHDPYQMKASTYMEKFQIPILPELKIKANDFKLFRNLWAMQSAEEVEDYLNILRPFCGRKAVLDWYRANNDLTIKYGDVYTPTLFIWGNADLSIGRVGVEGTKDYMKGEYQFIELDAGHWLIQEKYEVIAEAITEHIKNHPIQSESAWS